MGIKKKKASAERLPEIIAPEKVAELLKCSLQQLEVYVNEEKITPIAEGPSAGNFPQSQVLNLLAELDAERIGTPHDFPVVGIGASAGGLEAVGSLLEALPSDLGMAYVFISHLSPDHESLLPEILAKKTKMPVHKVQHGMKLQPDQVFVIPPNTTMYIVDSVLTLYKPRIRSDKGFHPINEFLIALSEAYQQNAIGIILSGTASDGTMGLKAIRSGGGWTFAQDASAKFDEMPRTAREAGVVDFVMPPDQIARQLAALREHPVAQLAETKVSPLADDKDVHRILSLLHARHNVDLTQYKRSTINRRILRRMMLHKLKDLKEYAAMLRSEENELDELFHDLLINVTTFFREPTFYKSLSDVIFPALLKDRTPGQPFRIWVAGCSTGEESVSIAITLLENFSEQLGRIPVQIFSTDLDGQAIAYARQGVYNRSAIEGLSQQRLNQYFSKVENEFKVIKPIKDMCVFAQHDLLSDPPFSRMDLITCQNVLIYLNNAAQQKVLRSFHYALQMDGFLTLGRSETTNAAAELFQQVDKEARLYSKKGTRVHLSPDLAIKNGKERLPVQAIPVGPNVSGPRVQDGRIDTEMDRLLLHRHIPASILVSKDLEILRFRGATAPYMAPHTGRASLHLLKMIREDLVFELRTLMRRAKEEKVPVMREGLELDLEGSIRKVSIEIVPMRSDLKNDHYLIVFQDEGLQMGSDEHEAQNQEDKDQRDKKISQLEREIRELRDQVRVVSEEAQVSTEELQTANEEVLSSNEELQSLNEELETSKEELQSTNEELTTINDELQSRNDELKEARDYAQAVIGTLSSPLLIVNANMRVRMANRAFYRIFQTTPEETEGMLIHELGNHQWEVAALRKHLFDVLSQGTEMRDFEVNHTFPHIGERIIRLNAHRIERGAVQHRILITMEDITERRRSEEAVERLAAIVSSSDDAIVGLDLEGNITSWNEGAERLFGYAASEVIGRSMDLLLTDEQLTKERSITGAVQDASIRTFETVRKCKDGRMVDVAISVSPIKLSNGNVIGVSKIVRDITERKDHERELHARDRMYRAIGDSINYGIFVCDEDGNNIYSSESFLRLIGLTQEECAAMGWARALHPEDAQKTILSWRKSVKEGTLWASEHRYKGIDGGWHYILARGVPFRDDAGELKGWVGINLDITEQKRMEAALRESELRFQMLADHMDQLAWIADAAGNEIWFNKRWQDFTGRPMEQIGQHLHEIHHPGHYHRVMSNIRSHQQRGEAWEDTFPMKGTDGEFRWFLARAIPVRNNEGRIVNWFGTSTDITDRMNAEDELRKTDRSKDHFLATLAHELRNPLAPLRSGVEVLSFSAHDEQIVKSTCAIMDRQVGQMVRLIDDLMDLGRISTGRLILRRETMDLGKAIEVAIEALEPMMRQQHHHFTVKKDDQQLMMHGDSARITQVISNLLHNAAKYTDPGGDVELIVQREGDEAVITVKDSGMGIQAEMLDQVFDMFSQIEQEQRSQRGGGLGIGLHIVQRLVNMHGGTIEVNSEGKGKGTIFTLRLPLKMQEGTPDAVVPKDQRVTNIGSKRVLLVDDDPDAPLMLSLLLRSFGCETRSALSGEAGIREARTFRPDIILMDISMPGMDGFEACRKIRSQRWGKHMRIYALTGWGQDVDRKRSAEAGFDDHLVKPVDRSVLEGLLEDRPITTNGS